MQPKLKDSPQMPILCSWISVVARQAHNPKVMGPESSLALLLVYTISAFFPSLIPIVTNGVVRQP